MTVFAISPSQIDIGLRYSNFYWGGSTVTYSIPNGMTLWAPGYEEVASASYRELNQIQTQRFVAAIELWDSYIALSLEEVDDGATYGDIRVAYTEIPEEYWGYAYIPPENGGTDSQAGDIWISSTYFLSTYAEGSYDYQALLHEIGHALGLKHPHETPLLPEEYDSSAYTLMSYNHSFEWRIVLNATNYAYLRVDDATPMVLDIAAIQSRYGADPNTAAGDTTYTITDKMTQSRRAIYDAGGIDTVDLSQLSRGSHLDLRPGAYSDLAYFSKAAQIAAAAAAYPGIPSWSLAAVFNDAEFTPYEWTNNFGIAYSTVIENVVGSAFDDTIIGNDANNVLDGGLGRDILTGGKGQDTFRSSHASLDGTTITDLEAGDTIVITASGAVITSLSRSGGTLGVVYRTSQGETRELRILTEGQFGTLYFNDGTITVGGSSGDDTFLGRNGTDTYFGGNGSDTVDYGFATTALRIDLGIRTPQYVGWKLGDDTLLSIENLVGGSSGDSLTGSGTANAIRGGGGADNISGRGGGDVLAGEAGNDRLDGGVGADTLFGGAGDDTYIVDNAGDVIREDTVAGIDDGGIDRIEASVSFTLAPFVENLTLTTARAIDAVGNALDNTLIGNNAANVLSGLEGADILRGGGGHDRLDGEAGADLMLGGAGNDTYVVDDIGDVAREDAALGGGKDHVEASVSFGLGDFVENLTLTGSGPIDGHGNALANTLIGNRGANRISGFEGADTLDGGAGNDTLRGGDGRDTLAGGLGRDDLDGEDGGDTYYVDGTDTVADSGASGIDLVISNASFTLATGNGIENLRSVETATSANLTGNELDNAITGYGVNNLLSGMAGADTLRAGAGDDRLRGGLGADRLYGEAGADTFIFGKGDSLAKTGRDGADTVFDFTTGEDRIDLNIFVGNAPTSAYGEVEISSDSFVLAKKAAEGAMTGGVKAVFVAGAGSGWLFWSNNGLDGTAEEAVTLAGLNTLAGFDRTDLV